VTFAFGFFERIGLAAVTVAAKVRTSDTRLIDKPISRGTIGPKSYEVCNMRSTGLELNCFDLAQLRERRDRRRREVKLGVD